MAEEIDRLTALLAKALKSRREERGLTLDGLASAAGLHRTSLGLIERGRRGMTVGVAARLCWALDLSLAEAVALVEAEARQGDGAGG